MASNDFLTFFLRNSHNYRRVVNDSGFDISQGDIELYHTLNRGLDSI